jgi:type IV pilus assembly protein PilW
MLHRLNRVAWRQSRGVTLVELLVAMTLSIAIMAAASGVYLVSGQSFNTTDSASQLQDSARFATYILRRMVQQAGYEDYSQYALDRNRSPDANSFAGLAVCVQSDVCGFDNRVMKVADVINTASTATGSTGTLAGPFYTDTLIVRFQGQSTISASTGEPTTTPDGSMMDCSGSAVPSSTVAPPTRAMSSLYVAINGITGEPELNCSSMDPSDGSGRPAWPLVKGVEVFKVMYEVGNGVDQTLQLDPSSSNKINGGSPDRFRWVRADEVAGLSLNNFSGALVPNAVNAWRSVVAVRFGLVLRGDVGSAVTPTTATVLYPLGKDLARANDPATTYTPPLDSRLRRVVTFTVHIRSTQNVFVPTI